MNILDELASLSKKRVEIYKSQIPLAEIRKTALSMKRGENSFENAIRNDKDLSFICECKKASPSKGLIEPNFDYLNIAREYERAGATCISVLTEPEKFLGNDRYLTEISKEVKIPTLRKDFTVDEYMIYQAKTLGASCVLLICSILDKQQISDYLNVCRELGLSALVECHDEREIETALETGATMIGVNNRNLKTFDVDMSNSSNLRAMVPKNIVFVGESGVKTRADVEKLTECGVDACLIGEAMMRAEDKSRFLNDLKGI